MAFQLYGRLSDEEQLLVRRMEELYARAGNGSPALSSFLNSREQFIIQQMLPRYFAGDESDPLCFFWGGYPDAERAIFCCLPAYYRYALTEDTSPADVCRDELSAAITPLRVKSSGYVRLAHRDFLGALTGLGIDRAALGDILLDDEGAILFASPKVADFLKNELVSIGRDKVKTVDVTLPVDFRYTRSFESIRGTVASARLDGVLSELCRTSRETAKELIRQGLVDHNHFPATEPDAEVAAGDILSARKVTGCRGGKFVIDSLDERSAKGRLRLEARRYL
ncbi:MAG: hypothetical protein E7632_07410 [Ruminococcaceae bacterium]|nr:hypothetical protein [Oscillospiraceae bacterium]